MVMVCELVMLCEMVYGCMCKGGVIVFLYVIGEVDKDLYFVVVLVVYWVKLIGVVYFEGEMVVNVVGVV